MRESKYRKKSALTPTPIQSTATVVAECLERRLCLSAPFVPAGSSPISVGTAPGAIAVGDFGNGRQDLAVANTNDNTVTILLNNGNGTFTPAPGSPITVGTGPAFIVTGHFDHSGNLDLVVGNSNLQTADNTLTVLLGNGNGTFTQAPGSPIALGNAKVSVAAIATGDFNGDSNTDLAITNSGDNDVSVLLGNGDGTFTAAPDSPFAVGNSPVSIVAGDFNGDNNLDLATANLGDGTVSLLLGDGHGGFAAAPSSPIKVGTEPAFLVAGDFTANNATDLAVANFADDTVSILLNNGTGVLTPATGSPVLVGTGPNSMTVADFDGNGPLELAVTNSGDNTVSLLSNSGGTFTASSLIPVGMNPDYIVSGDFDGNNTPDLAVANANDNTVSVLLNSSPTPTPTPVPTPTPIPTPTPLPTGTAGVAVASSLPASIVAGVKMKATAVVTISAPVGSPITGRSTVTLYAGPNQSLDGATKLTSAVVKLKLKPGAKKALRLKLSAVPSTLAGSYFLIAAIQSPDATTTAVAGQAITIQAPVISIVTSNVAGVPVTVLPGKKLTLDLSLQDTGNIPASGKAALTVSLSGNSSGTGGTTVDTASLRVKLGVSHSKVYRVKFVVPAGTTAGAYYLGTSLIVSSLGDPTAANSIAVSSLPITVT